MTSEIAGQMTTKLHQLAAMHTNLTPTVIAKAKTSVEKAVTLNGYQLGFLVSSIVLIVIAIPAIVPFTKEGQQIKFVVFSFDFTCFLI